MRSIVKITYFMVELWKLDLHLLSLEKMVLGLFTHGRDHIELPGYGVGFLGRKETAAREGSFSEVHTRKGKGGKYEVQC